LTPGRSAATPSRVPARHHLVAHFHLYIDMPRAVTDLRHAAIEQAEPDGVGRMHQRRAAPYRYSPLLAPAKMPSNADGGRARRNRR
jgi:hypothetical protein